MKRKIKRPLSNAEAAVNYLLLQGFSNKEIAERLHVCEKTIKFHITSILFQSESKSSREHIAKHYVKTIERLTFAPTNQRTF